MEIQLQELIDQIKKDGVAAAEAEAEAIVSGAREKASAIISRIWVRVNFLHGLAFARRCRIAPMS